MPYITENRRDMIIDGLRGDYEFLDYKDIESAGELQFAMAVMFKSYMERKGLNYQNCNDVMGALAGAQMEFYRRTVAPYEDLCIEKNGDV